MSGAIRYWLVAAAALLAAATAPHLAAQTMPSAVYLELSSAGHERLAERIHKKLEMRQDPDDEDVSDLIRRWEEEAGGPTSALDWVTVGRLWLRAGMSAHAEHALRTADDIGGLPPAMLLLDQARIAFLSRDYDLAEEAYWKGCEVAEDETAQQYWLDIEVLATPEELAEWDRFRRLPASQTDLCRHLRGFWGERALASTMTIADRMGQHYARIRYAQNNYRRRSGRKAATFSNELGRPVASAYDDRGLLYIRMGEPDRTTQFASPMSAGLTTIPTVRGCTTSRRSAVPTTTG